MQEGQIDFHPSSFFKTVEVNGIVPSPSFYPSTLLPKRNMNATEEYGPDDKLNFDYMSGEEEFPHLKEHWRNVRKGGPKEKRLRKIISMIPDTRKDEMHAIRLSNVYVHVDSEDLYDRFEKIGPIGDFFRPTNTATMLPTQYCFIRYLDKGNAEKAIETMQGAVFGGFTTGGIWIEQRSTSRRQSRSHSLLWTRVISLTRHWIRQR